ncbi:MAG: TolC family outer membrane protein [Marinicellaceae bacterium]
MKKILLCTYSLAFSISAYSADLTEIFKQSENHDPQLSAAQYTLEATQEGKKQAFAAFLPQVSSSYGRTFSKNKRNSSLAPGVNPSTTGEPEDWNVRLSQSLYDHANYENFKISELEILKSAADYDIAYQDFILRVAQSYFNVLSAKDSLVFAKAEEKAIQRQLDQAEQRFEVGLAAITDVHEARATFDGARARVIVANNTLEDANEALFEISQRYYPEIASAPDEIEFTNFTVQDMDAFQELGIRQNPEVISSQIAKDIAEKRIAVNRSGHYPTLDLSFSRGQTFSPGSFATQVDPQTGNPIQIGSGDIISNGTTASLNLSIPIYSGGRTSSQVRQAALQHKAAMDRYEQARRSTVRNIRNAYHGFNASKSSIEARKLAMISAQSGLEATEAGYEVGTRTIVDVLNSQQRLYQAQGDYSRAKYDYFIQFLSLKQAAGSLNEQDINTINAILK